MTLFSEKIAAQSMDRGMRKHFHNRPNAALPARRVKKEHVLHREAADDGSQADTEVPQPPTEEDGKLAATEPCLYHSDESTRDAVTLGLASLQCISEESGAAEQGYAAADLVPRQDQGDNSDRLCESSDHSAGSEDTPGAAARSSRTDIGSPVAKHAGEKHKPFLTLASAAALSRRLSRRTFAWRRRAARSVFKEPVTANITTTDAGTVSRYVQEFSINKYNERMARARSGRRLTAAGGVSVVGDKDMQGVTDPSHASSDADAPETSIPWPAPASCSKQEADQSSDAPLPGSTDGRPTSVSTNCPHTHKPRTRRAKRPVFRIVWK